MKRTYNKLVHGVGYAIFAFGFILMIKAAGLADTDGVIDDIMRIAAAGAVACLGGFGLTRWNV